MAAKIDITQLGQHLKGKTLDLYNKALAEAIPEWSNIAKEEAKNLIVETIKRGQSPVENGRGQTGGQSRFVDYSVYYKRMIESSRRKTGKDKGRRRKLGSYLNIMAANGKRLRPVNLTVTGEMLRSIKARIIPNGFSIWFTSKLAKYHTELGAGRSKVKRKMLPVDNGDQFTRLINKGLVDKFRSILLLKLNKG